MYAIVGKEREPRGYRIGEQEVTILYFADGAVLIAEREDSLQRPLHQFIRIENIFNL